MSEALRIKPVSKDYFKTSKVTLRDIALKRRSGIAIFATRLNPDGTQTDVFLIPEPARSLTIGKFYAAEHASTRRKYGEHQVIGVMSFKFKSGILHIDGYDVGTAAYAELFDAEGVAFQLV